jgi:hypothetical protein
VPLSVRRWNRLAPRGLPDEEFPAIQRFEPGQQARPQGGEAIPRRPSSPRDLPVACRAVAVKTEPGGIHTPNRPSSTTMMPTPYTRGAIFRAGPALCATRSACHICW